MIRFYLVLSLALLFNVTSANHNSCKIRNSFEPKTSFPNLIRQDSLFHKKHLNNVIASTFQQVDENNHNATSKLSGFTLKKPIMFPLGIAAVGIVALFGIPKFASAWTKLRSASDSGFLQSFLLVVTSELGDKTFFISALTAAKHGKLISFIGSIGALASMTMISAMIGQLLHAIPSSWANGIPYEKYIAIAAFSYFGSKTIFDAMKLPNHAINSSIQDEKEEAAELLNTKGVIGNNNHQLWQLIFQIFSLVFAAEVGDRSFLSTIALSTTLNPLAVTAGAICAYTITSSIAVIGGEVLSKYLSEKVIGYIGGSLFLMFAGMTVMSLLR